MQFINFILIFLSSYFIAGVIHELGHIIVGLFNGWKFHLLVIGPLGIKRDDSGELKIYFEKNLSLWGGVGATLPKESDNDNIKVWSKVLLGGPIASILMGLVFLPIGIIMDNITLLLLGAMPLGMGIMSGLPLPLKTGILFVDGKRWYRLHSDGKEANEEIALFKIAEHISTGGKYSSIKLSSIDILINSKEVEIKYYGYYCKYHYYKEQNSNELMLEVINDMESIKDKVPKLILLDCKID